MFQDGTDALLCWGIVLKVLISQSNKRGTFNILLKVLICQINKGDTLNIVITSHLIFMAQGTLLIDHLPY
jgi:hypothetical protein